MVSYEQLLDRDLDWALQEGSMHFGGGSATDRTLRRIFQRLKELEIDYAIVAGVALFFHGYRRFTEDVKVLERSLILKAVRANLLARAYVRSVEKSANFCVAFGRIWSGIQEACNRDREF